jgi:Zn-dependent protease with chaperone function
LRIYRHCLVLVLFLLVALRLYAQDFDEDSGAADDMASPALLTLNFDRQGALDARLILPDSATASDALPDLLAQALHCSLGSFKHPSERDVPSSTKWSAAKRERLRQQMAAANQRQLRAHCDAALAHQDQLLQADFDLASVNAEFRKMGVDYLTVYVDLPKAPYLDYSQANLLRQPAGVAGMLVYAFPLAQASATPVFQLAYGFRIRDLYRAFAILAAFILVPVLLTLWMRRRALASVQIDPAGAWFGFFRTLNWLINGAMLVWITSGFGARPMLQEWVLQQGFTPFKTALADVTIAILPSFLVYFFCLALCYPVHATLRRSRWTRREFFWRQLITVGGKAIPLMMGIAAVEMIGRESELSVVLLLLTFALMQIFQILRIRVIKEFPHPLTTGDLRDRIFTLAQRLGVTVNQIFVIPAGKGQIANAYAAKNRIVMFTDYLLEHLSKREVDGVAAHELGHLRHKHPAKLTFALIAAIFLPQYFSALGRMIMGLAMMPLSLPLVSNLGFGSKVIMQTWRAFNGFELWSQRDLILLMAGMTGFYFLSRHFEYVADATAVRLTGDAEAQITGLLKVNRLNLIPIRWGKASESWLTHPATVRRAERMAAVGGLAPERLQQILRDYDSQNAIDKPVPPEDRYPVPPVGDTGNFRVAMREHSRRQGKLWLEIASYVGPPAAFALLIPKLHLSGLLASAAYLAGVVATTVLVYLVALWLGESGRGREKQRLADRFARERIPAGLADDIAVAFAPGPYPRIYGTKYHWDAGFLIWSKDRMQFVGEQVRFSFSRAEIDGIAVGRGGPSWRKFERLYVHWTTSDGHNGVFNLNSLEGRSIWDSNAHVRALAKRLQEWRRDASQFPVGRPGLADMKALDLGQVTSVSPKLFGTLRVNLRVLLMLLPFVAGISVLLHANLSYLLMSVVLVRIVHSIPYWRYRDTNPIFSAAEVGQGAAAGAP